MALPVCLALLFQEHTANPPVVRPHQGTSLRNKKGASYRHAAAPAAPPGPVRGEDARLGVRYCTIPSVAPCF